MSDIHAEPFSPLPVEKFEYIVSKCCAHRPWFDDDVWNDPKVRRETVIAHLSDAHTYGKLFEVWKDRALVGMFLCNELVPFRDVRCHFIFFDGTLSGKRQLCLNMMGWCFAQLPVEILRVEIPTYANWLLRFTQKSLGFRPEGSRYDVNACQLWDLILTQVVPGLRGRVAREMRKAQRELGFEGGQAFVARTIPLPSFIGRLGGRKYRATKYKGEWHDLILLSVTADEFVAFCREQNSDGHESQAPQSRESAEPHAAGT